MQPDIVIPYLHNPKSNGTELKMCLRSIEKYLTGYRDIWIIGELPTWIKNVKQIQVQDDPDKKQKEKNIYRKIITACNHPEISENFLFYNDDQYLLKTYNAKTFPYYHRGCLVKAIQKNTTPYRATLIHSKRSLELRKLPTLDFDCHCPIIYNKKKFIEAFDSIQWRDWGFAIKSMYANYAGIEGEQTTDCKISSHKLRFIQTKAQNRHWFSTGSINPEMEKFLSSHYPKKSFFEKQ